MTDILYVILFFYLFFLIYRGAYYLASKSSFPKWKSYLFTLGIIGGLFLFAMASYKRQARISNISPAKEKSVLSYEENREPLLFLILFIPALAGTYRGLKNRKPNVKK